MSRYTTLEDVKDRLDIADTAQDANLEAAIAAAERLVDAYCGRSFTVPTASTVRRFTAETPSSVWVDDAVTVNAVAVDLDGDGTAETTVTRYDPWPFDAAARSMPYVRVLVPDGGLPLATGAVHVTAAWGWPEVPAAVRTAAEIQAGVLWRRGTSVIVGLDEDLLREAGLRDVRFASRYLDQSVQLLLAPYRKVRLA